MRFFTAGASLFLVFIAAGIAIKCRVCRDRASEDCSGKLVKCHKTVKSCSTIITEFKFEGLDQINSVYKNCSGSRSKTVMYRSAVSNGFYQLRVKVCRKNGCNKKPLKLPPLNRTLNGVRCPTCNVTGAMTCEADGVVECVGRMTKCIYMAATFHRPGSPPVAYRGCSSLKKKKQYPQPLRHKNMTVEISKGI
uniref:Sodefrin-like factor n=1 Tax=Ichthyosaura alpestris TaxID=54263 RepID=A0A0F7JJU4_ICHAP|nr:sodefrin precursor-like factor [Ichthyosaura alpestris]